MIPSADWVASNPLLELPRRNSIVQLDPGHIDHLLVFEFLVYDGEANPNDSFATQICSTFHRWAFPKELTLFRRVGIEHGRDYRV